MRDASIRIPLWLLTAAAGLAFAACSSPEDEDPSDPCEGGECDDDDADEPPCDGVDCSGHAECVEEEGAAVCECDFTYHAEGLDCLADELPPLSCEGGWVTHHLEAPVAEVRGYAAAPARPLALRSRRVLPVRRDLCAPHVAATQRLAIVRIAADRTRDIDQTLRTLGARRIQPLGGGFQLVDLGATPHSADLCESDLVEATTSPRVHRPTACSWPRSVPEARRSRCRDTLFAWWNSRGGTPPWRVRSHPASSRRRCWPPALFTR